MVKPFASVMAKAQKQSLEKTLDELLAIVAAEKTTIPKDLQVMDSEVSKLSCKFLMRAQTYLYGQVA